MATLHAAAGFPALTAGFCLGTFAAIFFGDDFATAADFVLLEAAGFDFLGDLAAGADFAFVGDLTFSADFAFAVVFVCLTLVGDLVFSADLALGLLAFFLVTPAEGFQAQLLRTGSCKNEHLQIYIHSCEPDMMPIRWLLPAMHDNCS